MVRFGLCIVATFLLQVGPLFAEQMHHHHSATVDVSTSSPVPQVSIEVTLDSVGGWNIKVSTAHFRFAPEHVNQAHISGEGHAHLYVNGEKIARLYGHWFHLPKLDQGEHELRVTLNANDHAAYSVNGKLIEATTSVLER